MSAPTDQDILDNVKTAINKIMSGGAVQSYSIGGRNLQRMTLKELRDLRQDLEARIAASSTQGSRTYGSFARPN